MSFRILLVVAILAIFVSGCGDSPPRDETENYILPADMNDCKIYIINRHGGGGIQVVRCPNSSVSLHAGKQQTFIIDGVVYDAKSIN